MTPTQQGALDAAASGQYNFILFGGAMGGGKTVWGLSALLMLCQMFPRSRWCVVRQDMERLRSTTVASFMRLEPAGRWRSSLFEYTHPNGSVILFKGENYDNDKELYWMRGLEVNGFLFEEINECTQGALDIAFSRAGRWDCTPRPAPLILATCNPSQNWVKERIYNRYAAGTLPPNWLYLPSRITDNPHLTKAYVKNLENMPRYRYEVLVNGDWDLQMQTGGEFYKCFDLERHVAPVQYNPELPLHVSWDDNVNPYLPCGIFQVEGKNVYLVDEIAGVSPGNTIKWVCKELVRRFQAWGHKGGVFIYGDATANKEDTKLEKGYDFFRLITDDLREFHPRRRVLPSNPSVVMRGNWINTVLEQEHGGIKIVIGVHCKRMVTDLVSIKEAPDGSKLKEMETDPRTKARQQKYGHFSDLLDYFLCSCFEDEFKAFQRGSSVPVPAVRRNLPSGNAY